MPLICLFFILYQASEGLSDTAVQCSWYLVFAYFEWRGWWENAEWASEGQKGPLCGLRSSLQPYPASRSRSHTVTQSDKISGARVSTYIIIQYSVQYVILPYVHFRVAPAEQAGRPHHAVHSVFLFISYLRLYCTCKLGVLEDGSLLRWHDCCSCVWS